MEPKDLSMSEEVPEHGTYVIWLETIPFISFFLLLGLLCAHGMNEGFYPLTDFLINLTIALGFLMTFGAFLLLPRFLGFYFMNRKTIHIALRGQTILLKYRCLWLTFTLSFDDFEWRMAKAKECSNLRGYPKKQKVVLLTLRHRPKWLRSRQRIGVGMNSVYLSQWKTALEDMMRYRSG